MKKLFKVLTLLLVFFMAVGQLNAKTIYFKNTQNWAPPYAYAWVGGNNNGGFPGQKMKVVESNNNIWKIDLNDNFVNVIFSQGNSNGQTENLSIPAEGDSKVLYDYSEKKWIEYTEPTPEPKTPKYSLVGTIDGKNYGWDSDYMNPGEHIFDEEGKLIVNFSQTSYVCVKLTDNSKWFLSKDYVPQAEAFIDQTATTTATMVNGADYGEKMQVPAGEVEISLSVTDENTVVLTYSLPGTKEHERVFLRHDWNQEGWSWKELELNGDGTYSVVAQYGDKGCNYTTNPSEAIEGQSEDYYHSLPWIEKDHLNIVGTPAVGDWCEFTFNPTNNSITVTKLYPSVYVIVGDEEIKLDEYMYEDSKKEIRVDYTSGNTTKELKADDKISFKMVSADGSVTKYLVPDFNKKGILEDVLDGKYSCVFKESETPGSYTVKNDGTYHFAVSLKDGVVMISGNIITGVEDVEVAGKAVKAYKVIENGQVVIVRGEQRFNIMGQPIR